MDAVSERGDVLSANDCSHRQLITCLLKVVIGAAAGVQAVETDPVRPRVWVFANGAVDPEALCDALTSWGHGACVLENQFTAPA